MFSHAAFLRWSAQSHDYPVDLRGVADPLIHAGVPGARVLVTLVDSFLLGAQDAQEQARHEAIDELGVEGYIDAAAVFGNFEMMNRVAEGTGVLVPPQRLEREADLMELLGLERVLKPQHR